MSGTLPGGSAISRPMATARLKLGAGDAEINVPVSVPSEPVLGKEVLPAIRRLQNELVSAAEKVAARQGRPISCKAGCGACCRQPVPLADVEAVALAELVERMEEPRRSTIRQRFVEAEQKLEESGIAERLRRLGAGGMDDPTVRALAAEYFKLGIACPFLEAESCSIYGDRPVTCRAYVVTSPASFCTDTDSRETRTLAVLHLSPAVQGMTSDPAAPQRRWIVMTLAFDWLRRHPAPSDRRPGPYWITAMLKVLQRTMAG